MNPFEFADNDGQQAVIKVIGVGGGGNNAVAYMVEQDIEGIDFICANTDSQALKTAQGATVLQLGNNVTKGLGAGANPEIGRQSAMEDRDGIHEVLDGADMVFITAGMGGGTGTGAAPVVAQVAKEMGILTVAVITKPFPFEGKKRMKIANEGIEELRQHVDSMLTIPNEKLLVTLDRSVTLLDAFKRANDVLSNAVQGISELITRPGLINVDFADVRTVMEDMGTGMMGVGSARGDNRAEKAAQEAISSPLLADIALSGARGILVNVTAGMDMAIGEFQEVGDIIRDIAADDANVVIGTAIDMEMAEELRVTVVATGLNETNSESMERNVRMVANGQQNQARTATTSRDFRQFDRSPKLRQASEPRDSSSQRENNSQPRASKVSEDDAKKGNMDYLDIPAFLRRQAD